MNSRSRNATTSRGGAFAKKIGLRPVLVGLLIVAALLYIGGAIVNERSIGKFYGEQPDENVYFGAPAVMTKNTSASSSPSLIQTPSKIDAENKTKTTITGTNEKRMRRPSSVTKEEGEDPETIVETTESLIPNQENKKYHNDDNDEDPVENLEEDEKDVEILDPGAEDGSEEEEDTNAEDEDIEEEEDEDDNNDMTKIDNNQTLLVATLDEIVPRPWLLKNRSGLITLPTSNRTVVAFEKQEGVVIVTKIHGKHHLPILEQSLCLLHFAYNRRPLYDIVVFTTLPVPEEMIAPIQKLVHPARLTVVVDNRGLQEEIAALSKPRYDAFLKACGVTSPVNLTWWSECPGRVAYNWQAEFRTWHIWNHLALRDYSIMMWLDADAFCTTEWPLDPIQAMIENDLVILFDNWPKGRHTGKDVQERIYEAFGLKLCHVRMLDGHFKTKVSNTTCKLHSGVGDIHGFFHITNLDFYRSVPVQKWAETWIGNGFLQRRYDDQAGVTVPAAILAPERSWHMRRNKIVLSVYHNFDLDGSKGRRVGGFKKYWRKTARHQLPGADGVCQIKAGN
jgi:hypothetical protein